MASNAAEFSVDPTVWGPHVWATMHTLALKADQDSELGPFLEFLNSLTFLLPCANCRHDYSKYYSSNGGPTPGGAFAWTIKLHNWVSEKIARQKEIAAGRAPREFVGWTVEGAHAYWTQSNCSYKCAGAVKSIEKAFSSSGEVFAFLAAVLLLSIVYFLYKRTKNVKTT